MSRHRVYVSSTFADLATFRHAVCDAVQRAGFDLAAMEHYAAADDRPLDFCLRDVADADVYVGLLGWRYGYVPPAEHGNPDGLSITELEYRRARATGKPVLLFFTDPSTRDSWRAEWRDDPESDAGRRLGALRDELGRERMASFFSAEDELATKVLAAIVRDGQCSRRFDLPSLPDRPIARPAVRAELTNALTNGRSVLLSGGGGFGKSTLAIDACAQPDVVAAFPDGMLWTPLGTAPNLDVAIGSVIERATGKPPGIVGVDALTREMQRVLAGRRLLIVLDDVWTVAHLRPFLGLDGPTVLVTTRIGSLANAVDSARWTDVAVPGMTPAEATALLERGLSVTPSVRRSIGELAERLGYWPLLLQLANGRLREELRARGDDLAATLTYVTRVFEKRGVFGFDARDGDAREQSVAHTVELGIEAAQQRIPGLRRRALELSVFAENRPIPTAALQQLWDIDEFDVEEDVLRPLDDLGLLRWDRAQRTVTVHMMIDRALEQALERETPGAARATHARLVAAWTDPYALPYDYAWRQYAWHCAEAGEPDRVRTLLADFRWLRAKLVATDIAALLADFDLIGNREEFVLLRGALELSAHVLAHDSEQLSAQLLGRLARDGAELVRNVLDAASARSGTWLRPLAPTLAAPGGTLERTIEVPSGTRAVAISPDPDTAMTAGDDGLLRVWDLARGEVRFLLEGHTQPVHFVAFLDDGSRAVSVDTSGVVYVWDLVARVAVQRIESPVDEAELVAHEERALQAERVALGDRAYDGEHQARLNRKAELVWNWVPPAAVSDDGRWLIVGRGDASISVIDTASASIERSLTGHRARISAVAFGADGNTVISIDVEGDLRQWDTVRGTGAGRMKTGMPGPFVIASLGEDQLLVGERSGSLKRWNLERRVRVATYAGHTGTVRALAATRDGRSVVSAGQDGTVRRWDLDSGATQEVWSEHAGAVVALAMSSDGSRAISVGIDRTMRTRRLANGDVAAVSDHAGAVTMIACAANAARAITVGDDRQLHVWDTQSGAHVAERGALLPAEVIGATISADGGMAVVSCGAKTRNNRLVVVHALGELFTLPEPRDWSRGGPWTPFLHGESGTLFALGYYGDFQKWEEAGWVDASRPNDLGPTRLADAALDAGARVVAVAETLDTQRDAAVDDTPDSSIGASNDRRHVVDLRAFPSGALMGQIRLWEWFPDQSWPSFGRDHGDGRLALSPAGSALGILMGDRVLTWHVGDGRALESFELPRALTTERPYIAIPDDGSFVVATLEGPRRRVAVFDAASGREMTAFHVEARITALAIAADNRTILAGDAQGHVHRLRLEGVDSPS